MRGHQTSQAHIKVCEDEDVENGEDDNGEFDPGEKIRLILSKLTPLQHDEDILLKAYRDDQGYPYLPP